MTDWQERVREEEKELSKKIADLGDFMFESPLFGDMGLSEQDLLAEQYLAMCSYRRVLRARIERFLIDAKY